MRKSIVYEGPNQYFEAVIQIRPKDEEVLKFIQKKVVERKGVFISKIMEMKTGWDITISSQRFARTLGTLLKRRFKGWELKVTRTLHTRDKLRSKDVYRGTVCFRKKKEDL
tara:strand:- start:658 stop:990 length:333 start_codon:yes stop_codon:yes gene_type:complete